MNDFDPCENSCDGIRGTGYNVSLSSFVPAVCTARIVSSLVPSVENFELHITQIGTASQTFWFQVSCNLYSLLSLRGIQMQGGHMNVIGAVQLLL